MARRGSRTHHTHAIRDTDTTKVEVWEADSPYAGKLRGLGGPTWCGETYGYNTLTDHKGEENVFAYSRRMTNCPGCSAAIGKALLKRLDGRVALEKAEVEQGKYGSYYRTAWAISIDGELIGHAVMQNGWGNPWELKDLRMPDKGTSLHEFGSTVSHQPSRSYPAKADDLCQNIHFASKEMMAVLALRCRERGELLFTVEERREAGRIARERREADEAERAANKIKYEAERNRKEGLRAERKATAINGLTEIEQRADLSNLERAGLQAALDIIMGKDVQ